MNEVSQQPGIVVIVSGIVMFFGFLVAGFVASTLKLYIDEEKLREEKSISKIFQYPFPPERILSAAGKRRVKIAKLSLLLGVIASVIAVFQTQIVPYL